MKNQRLAIILLLLSASCGIPASRAADPPKPVKVFILAGQSNMEGQAVADLDGKDYNDGKGTLNALLNDPAKAPLVKHLKTDKGEWAVRDDVWVRYQPPLVNRECRRGRVDHPSRHPPEPPARHTTQPCGRSIHAVNSWNNRRTAPGRNRVSVGKSSQAFQRPWKPDR